MPKTAEAEIQPGAIVQIHPGADTVFGGCFLTVETVRHWGVTGYVMIPDGEGPTKAMYRCRHEDYVPVGRAQWLAESDATKDAT
jgi:hypothetical protein